jgi:hypothetical protein
MQQQLNAEFCRQLLGAIEAWEEVVYPDLVGNVAARLPGSTYRRIPTTHIDGKTLATATDALRQAIRAVYGRSAPEIRPIEKLKLSFLSFWRGEKALRHKEFYKVVKEAEDAVAFLKDAVSDELEAWEAGEGTDTGVVEGANSEPDRGKRERKRNPRGRPPVSTPDADRKVYQAWKATGLTVKEFARSQSRPFAEIEGALKRDRTRRSRLNRKQSAPRT